jgi:hypothetical protein
VLPPPSLAGTLWHRQLNMGPCGVQRTIGTHATFSTVDVQGRRIMPSGGHGVRVRVGPLGNLAASVADDKNFFASLLVRKTMGALPRRLRSLRNLSNGTTRGILVGMSPPFILRMAKKRLANTN